MSEELDSARRLAAEHAIRERKRGHFIALASAVVALLGVALVVITGTQARKISASEERVRQDSIQESIRASRARRVAAYLRLGIEGARRGDYKMAIAAYDSAIQLDPGNPVLYDLKGYSLLRSRRLTEAVSSLEKSVAADTTYVWGHYNLSLAYWASGARDKALGEVKKTIAIDASFRDSIRHDVQFRVFGKDPRFKGILD
jgi:tetratricopeptide (TPR) repeat protein